LICGTPRPRPFPRPRPPCPSQSPGDGERTQPRVQSSLSNSLFVSFHSKWSREELLRNLSVWAVDSVVFGRCDLSFLRFWARCQLRLPRNFLHHHPHRGQALQRPGPSAKLPPWTQITTSVPASAG
jgi:hypothetical protein